MARLSRERYAQLYGPTTGDRIRLADTNLLVEVTEDRCGGPGLAGVSGVRAALAERLPQRRFVETAELGPGDAPVAVVFVVSAATALTESDCVLLDTAAEHTDAVVAVVSDRKSVV